MQYARFTSLMECCHAAVLSLDQAGVITYANPEAGRLLERDPAALPGLHFTQTFCPEAPAESSSKIRQFEIHLGAGENQRVLHCCINTCTGECCAPVGYMVSIEDRSEWRKLYEERERLMEMATISEVLPTILHEFKNPLASIQAMVELMTEDCENESLQDQLHGILMEIRRMKLGFEGLGSTTRNLKSIRHQAVDFGIREACLIFERQLKARGIELKTQIETMPLLPFDSGGIRGVLFNLLNNARQACNSGDEIEVLAGLNQGGESFYFTVRDTGPGMTPETLERCTKLFYTTKRMGSGIGLALCRNAVEKVGGRLDVSSVRGQGSSFTVTLPLNV